MGIVYTVFVWVVVVSTYVRIPVYLRASAQCLLSLSRVCVFSLFIRIRVVALVLFVPHPHPHPHPHTCLKSRVSSQVPAYAYAPRYARIHDPFEHPALRPCLPLVPVPVFFSILFSGCRVCQCTLYIAPARRTFNGPCSSLFIDVDLSLELHMYIRMYMRAYCAGIAACSDMQLQARHDRYLLRLTYLHLSPPNHMYLRAFSPLEQ